MAVRIDYLWKRSPPSASLSIDSLEMRNGGQRKLKLFQIKRELMRMPMELKGQAYKGDTLCFFKNIFSV